MKSTKKTVAEEFAAYNNQCCHCNNKIKYSPGYRLCFTCWKAAKAEAASMVTGFGIAYPKKEGAAVCRWCGKEVSNDFDSPNYVMRHNC